MHVVLVSVGTDGDIFPYVGVGAVLQGRGHAVTLVASEHYEPLARKQGFAFRTLVSTAENQELFEHPDFWHPIKNAPLMARWGARLLPRQYELLSTLVSPETVLVANPGVLAADLVHEKFGVPWTNLVLQPWMIPSSIAPPLMPNLTFLARAPRPVWQLMWHGLDGMVLLLMGRDYNRFRMSLGLRARRRIVRNWLSTRLAIGLFPAWFGPPQADWPSQVRLAGFPLFDGAHDAALPPDVLQFIEAGQPPVAFTFGTGMAHSAALFRSALDACEFLGTRAIFLTKYRDQLPTRLPPSVFHCAFAPFQKLFPRCGAVMHHGGIGTVASAIAAGVPQLILPLCFDQIDNGARVKRLGLGDCLRARGATGRQIAAALTGLMTDGMRAQCRQAMKQTAGLDALTTAAELVESLSASPAPAR